MKQIITAIFFLFFLNKSLAVQKYEVAIDLINIKKDKINVEVKVPSCTSKTIVWCMPAIIPGTYARYDFGRFVSNFKAIAVNGKKLKVKRKSVNEFIIYNSEQLSKVSYKISDTWDANYNSNYVFQPAGTNIEKNKNVVLNHHGFVGYLEGMQNYSFEITIKKPKYFYASTSLNVKKINDEKDIEYANNYTHLADSPTLYCKPDTLSFKCKNSTIHISVYSSQNLVTASTMLKCVKPLSNALELFFNKLPVTNYHFLFYFSGKNDRNVWGNGSSGALEHNYSSLYFLPEIEDTITLFSLVKDVAAHEFLHILTPLNIHSFEIENFDYVNPKMSEHLWMYEGVTEYFSQLVQLSSGIISENQFADVIENKIRASNEFPPFSFTEMSKNVCLSSYKDYYDNVYQKGALIGFLLDIQLQSLSSNKFGLPELMNKLANMYGPEKPFVDSTLFNEITKATHPKLRDFFNDYVINSKPLPYKEYFERIGWTYSDSLNDTSFFFGKFQFQAYGNNNLPKIYSTNEDLNSFGLKNKDVITKINGQNANMNNWNLIESLISPKVKSEMKLEVIRKGKRTELIANPRKRMKLKKADIRIEEIPNKQQKELKQKLFRQQHTL